MNHEGSGKDKNENLYLQTMQSQKGGGGTLMISLMVRKIKVNSKGHFLDE